MRKNLLSLCAVVVMLLGTSAVNAASGTWTSGSTTVVLTDDGTLTVSGTGAMEDYYNYSSPWSAYRDAIKTLVINEGVTSVGVQAFRNCSGFSSVTIPNSVTSIGEVAFAGCYALSLVTIGNSVTSIGEGAFQGCSGLTSVAIGNSVTSIGERAFSSCIALTSIVIPESVTSIGNSAFSSCHSLTSFSVAVANMQYSSVEGVVYNKNQSVLLIYPAGKQGTFTIPSSVISIGNEAFAYCIVTSVTIPNSVTSIGGGAFQGCNGLTSVTIPNSVTSIENSAFSFCYYLTAINVDVANTQYSSVEGVLYNKNQDILLTYPIGKKDNFAIPASVTGIGNSAFSFCYLTSIVIGGSVTSIGENAFSSCSNLTSITIGNGVTSIGRGAFAHCGVTSITIGNSVISIGGGAFIECHDLTSVTIPESVTSIGESAFYYCSGLTSITIGNSVTSIENWAFAGCYALTSVTCLAATPPSIGYDNFIDVSTDTLYVPASSLNAYKSNSDWNSVFGEILPIGSGASIASITTEPVSAYLNPANGIVYIQNANGAAVKVYTLKGEWLKSTRENQFDLSSYPAGIYLLRVGDKTLKVVKQ